MKPKIAFIVYGVHKDGLQDPMGTPFIDDNIVNRSKQALCDAGLELVEHELNQGDEKYHVSGPRIRKLAIISGIANVEVHTRGNGKKWKGTKCPVCGSKLKESKNMTVYGDTVTLGYVCPRCTYCTGRERRMPSRYIFTRRRR